MNSADYPSCFDSTFWENPDGVSKRLPLAPRPYQPPTRMSLPAIRTEFQPCPPFNIGQVAGDKMDLALGRPLLGMQGPGTWAGYRQAVYISFDTKLQPITNPAQQCLSDINRLAFMPSDNMTRLSFFSDPSATEELGSRAPGTPLAPGTPRVAKNLQRQQYSRKVFVGGLPPDVTAESLTESFGKFGMLDVGWPRMVESLSTNPPKGFAFLQFQNEESVHMLVNSCYRVNNNSCVGFFTRISSPAAENKEVQVRPWNMRDSQVVLDEVNANDRNAIFVGGVPRPLTASQLAEVMSSLFGPVCAAAIETDVELGYPKGSARVTFRHRASKIAAISARFVQLSVEDINKRVEVKPFVLKDQPCGRCSGDLNSNNKAQFFCPNVACLEYLCQTCWAFVHANSPAFGFHKPLLQKTSDNKRPAGGVDKRSQSWPAQNPFPQRLSPQELSSLRLSAQQFRALGLSTQQLNALGLS